MALGIMVYHYLAWSGFVNNAGTFLGKIGVYGVSIFYVLSGLTLYIVYNEKLHHKTIGFYFIKRIFRIFPLLWLCIFLSIFFLGRSGDLMTIILNLTGLFGFFAHDKYIAIASWSIGNELVFYVLFPGVILLSKKTRHAPLIFFVISAAIACYFAFSVLSVNTPLWIQWSSYLNPLNQVVLFSGGVLTGQLLSGKKIPNQFGIAILLFSFLAFVFYPVDGDQGSLIAGINRIAFVFLSFLITASFFIIDFRIGKIAGFLLSKLGEISYSLYLLHPIVFTLVKKYSGLTGTTSVIISGFVMTILLSFLVYYFYETRFINLGQRIINRQKQKQLIAIEVSK
jgi:peptidoglycan/LPS O-acetylase OafA/YrhL